MSALIRRLPLIGAVALAVTVVAGAVAQTQANLYTPQDLVSDGTTAQVRVTDASLVNAWGLVAGPSTPWWAVNNGTNTSTLYNGSGAKQALTVAVAGGPTGAVFNSNDTDFIISQNGKSGAAKFLFATEGGAIAGWTPVVNPTSAVAAVTRAAS